MVDVDGNRESRNTTISIFNGPDPQIVEAQSQDAECAIVAKWLGERVAEGLAAHELAIFVRSSAEMDRAEACRDRGDRR